MLDLTISSDRLSIGGAPARYVESPNTGGRIVPEAIVLHDTAGALRPFSSVEWFQDPQCKTSAHFVVERDGTITQMVPCDVKAFHAGESVLNGRRYLNGWSVGIEIVNPGRLVKVGAHAVADFGAKFPASDCVEITSPAHGGKALWLPYTQEQIDAVTALCAALARSYPTIKDITTHWTISPGRKVDTGPHFPLEGLRQAVDAAVGAERAHESAPDGLALGASGPAVENAQERLADLGYAVGAVDGRFGPRLRAAVLAFEAENKLPTDGVLGVADQAVLLSDDAKAMPTGARGETTARDLREMGSGHMADAGAIKTVGQTMLAAGGVETGAQAALGVSPIETGFQYAERGLSLVSRAGLGKSFHLRPSYILALAALALGLGLLRWGGRIEWRRLAEHHLGLNLGR